MPANQQLSAVPASAAATTAPKRKTAPNEDEDDSGSDTGSDVSMINVDFDFYNLNTDVDQIALKRLLRQSLSHDDEMVDVHPLANLILEEGVRLGAGSSVKTEGEESDPWAMLAVVDVVKHKDNPAFKPFLEYLLSSLPPTSPIRSIITSSSSGTAPALVFSLRMLNLPLPLIPPLYKMLMSELQESSEAPKFSHWLIWGRGYKLDGGEEGMGLDLEARGKKSKKAKGQNVQPASAGLFPYHPEEEYIDKLASHVHTYPFKSAPKRDDDAFGVEQHGRLVLVETQQLVRAVKQMEEACQP